jgi:hypothetical protein
MSGWYALDKPLVTAGRLRRLLEYAPETGLFYWRVNIGAVRAGRQTGTCRAGGYPVIVVDRRRYFAHRLAWLYVHGHHPKGEIDHINGDKADNRIANLRDCSRGENARNVNGSAASGLKGAYRKGVRWSSRICVNRHYHYLGSFSTKEEAADAYDEAARLLHGPFARPNCRMPDSDSS